MKNLDPIEIRSNLQNYGVQFEKQINLSHFKTKDSFFLVDTKVAELYSSDLKDLIQSPNLLLIEASEVSKSWECLSEYIEKLISLGIKKNSQLVAIGGGIIQDIAGFVSSILYRGIKWHFYPTTLLAQADSCIGSKTSINFMNRKNLLGTFHPPEQITIFNGFLATLSELDINSGIGEILKIHILDSPENRIKILNNYKNIKTGGASLQSAIRDSLMIKKKYIEEDEFDTRIRNLLNYGHTFGHAIESALHFKVPHGIAVCKGMDLANYVSLKTKRISESTYLQIKEILMKNISSAPEITIAFEDFWMAISYDKKNIGTKIGTILVNENTDTEKVFFDVDSDLKEFCSEYLNEQ